MTSILFLDIDYTLLIPQNVYVYYTEKGIEKTMDCLTFSSLNLKGNEKLKYDLRDFRDPIPVKNSIVTSIPLEVNLKIIEDDGLVEKAAEMGLYIEAEVEKLKRKHKSIGDFRNTGLLGCIELVKNRKTKEPMTPWNAAPEDMEVTNKMAAKIRELGMFTFVRWNFIFVAPPLNVSKAEVDEGLKIISQAISIADKYCN